MIRASSSGKRAGTPLCLLVWLCAHDQELRPPRGMGSLAGGRPYAGGRCCSSSACMARAVVGIDGEVHVLLADDATLRRLNRQFRGKDEATDVLSFSGGRIVGFLCRQGIGRRSCDLTGNGGAAGGGATLTRWAMRCACWCCTVYCISPASTTSMVQGQMAAREAEAAQRAGAAGLPDRAGGELKREKTNTGVPLFRRYAPRSG